MRKRIVLAVMAAIVPAVFAFDPGSAAITPPKFRAPIRLPKFPGSEPSVAVDPLGSFVYVVAPPGWPAGNSTVFNELFVEQSPTDKGIALWVSPNGGLTFTRSANIGSAIGGGDTDVAIDRNGKVYVVDLEVASASICSSPRGGASWTSAGLPQADKCVEGVPFNHVGVIEDRPWIATGPRNEVYFAYHDFVTQVPVVMKSVDGGRTFTPCGAVFDPQGPAIKAYSPLNGTLVAKPVVGKDGTVYLTVSQGEPTATNVATQITRLYMAVAPGGCTEQTVWKNYRIYENAGADFKLFNQLAIDGGGVLYAVASGRTKTGQSGDNIWLFVSRNRGQTWSAPIRVNPTSLRGNVMPAVAGGLRGNQVVVGWFGTATNGDPSYTRNIWRYYAATSFKGGASWSVATLTSSPIHYGDICTEGLNCDVNSIANEPCFFTDLFEEECPSPAAGQPQNRNLYDFSSIAVNPRTGCIIAVFPGDPHNRPDIGGNNDRLSYAYVATQSSGTCLR